MIVASVSFTPKAKTCGFLRASQKWRPFFNCCFDSRGVVHKEFVANRGRPDIALKDIQVMTKVSSDVPFEAFHYICNAWKNRQNRESDRVVEEMTYFSADFSFRTNIVESYHIFPSFTKW